MFSDWLQNTFGEDLPTLLSFIQTLSFGEKSDSALWIRGNTNRMLYLSQVIASAAAPLAVLNTQKDLPLLSGKTPLLSASCFLLVTTTEYLSPCKDVQDFQDTTVTLRMPQQTERHSASLIETDIQVSADNMVFLGPAPTEQQLDTITHRLRVINYCPSSPEFSFPIAESAALLRRMAFSQIHTCMPKVLCTLCGKWILKNGAVRVAEEHAYHCSTCAEKRTHALIKTHQLDEQAA